MIFIIDDDYYQGEDKDDDPCKKDQQAVGVPHKAEFYYACNM